MPRNTLIVIALTLLVLSLPGLAQDEPKATKKPVPTFEELEAQSVQAFEDENWVRVYIANRKLEALHPWEPRYKINIVRAAGMLDRRNTAYHYMLQMQRQGLSYDFNQWPETDKIRATEVYEYMNDMMTKAGLPSGEGEVAWTLKARAKSFAALAWDESGQRFLLGQSNPGQVLAVDGSGNSEVLIILPEGSANVNGLAVGAKGETLWVSGDKLLQYDLADGKLRAEYSLGGDVPGVPGDLAVAPDGSVFVVDTANVLLLKLTSGSDALTTIPTGELLHEPTALALNSTGNQLYLADGFTGLVMVDTLAELAYPVTLPENLNVGFISGMVYHEGALLVVQTGFEPDRVMRLTLDTAGAAVENVAPMATALEPFDGPAAAVRSGDDLVYLGNARTVDARQSLVVLKTPLDAGEDLAPPDMTGLQDAIRQHNQQNSPQQQ